MFTPTSRRGRLLAATAVATALAALATPAGIAAAAGGPVGKPVVTATPPQVIAFPSRDFVSVAEPGGTVPTTTWTAGPTHPTSPVQTSTSTAPGLPTALGLVDVNHVGIPCWSSPLTPNPLPPVESSNMSPGDLITVTTPTGVADQQLSMTVADVTTVQAVLAPGSSTKVVVTGSAKDPVTGLQLGVGLVQVRLVAKKQLFTYNNRRELAAPLGGGKDGVFVYNTPGSTTDFSFTATFELLGAGNAGNPAKAALDAQQAIAAQTRGIVQNDPIAPTWITIYETHIFGDGLVHGNAPGCPAV